jgi:hypothetical protein
MRKRQHAKYPLFLSDFNETLIFSTDFREKPQISSFIKIRPVVAELFMRTDGYDEAKSLFTILQTRLKKDSEDDVLK